MTNINFPDFNQSNERNNSRLEKSLFNQQDLSDLPLTVDFSVGQAELSIKEVTQLTSGRLIELDTTEDIPISVNVHRKKIATGRIVIEDNKVFIQIL